MSKTILKIRRKSDGKILKDVINDSCDVHNIYDGDNLIICEKSWDVGYLESNGGFIESSEFEEVE